ncbi:putative heptose phosphatase [Aliarcobacter butzleri 7h1h]|nr:putative heptose phosphatase [Aliarcobacter butzleri 7h1h]
MKNEFKKNDIDILNVYFCPHAPEENCSCRKPQIGMITQSLNDFDIDLQKSWLIGDKMSDIQTAISANIPNKILISKEKDDKVLHVVETLFDTINIIKQ